MKSLNPVPKWSYLSWDTSAVSLSFAGWFIYFQTASGLSSGFISTHTFKSLFLSLFVFLSKFSIASDLASTIVYRFTVRSGHPRATVNNTHLSAFQNAGRLAECLLGVGLANQYCRLRWAPGARVWKGGVRAFPPRQVWHHCDNEKAKPLWQPW